MPTLRMDGGPPNPSRVRPPAGRIGEILRAAGGRCWTASVLPSIAGATLPFWLQPPGFSFNLPGAAVFAAAAVLLHAGFSLLSAYFRETAAARRQRCDFLLWTGVCTASACAAGVVLNRAVRHSGDAHPALFPVFGICALIAGILFAAPPAALGRRIGGEFAAAVGLGMLPVLGAYIVQAGGLTRTVYLASLPMAAATGLWVWVEELAAWREDEAAGRRTTVLHFGPGRSGRYGVPAIALVWAAAWAAAVASKSVSPLALAALPSAGLLWQIAAVFRAEHISAQAAGRARFCAFALHFATCAIIAVSSLLTPFG